MKKFLILFLFFSLLLFPFPQGGPRAADSNHPWPMYMANPQHTGRSPYPGPTLPQVKWTFSFSELGNWMNPSIGEDGTIYFCKYKSVYAFRPDGTLKWTYSLPSPLKASFKGCPAITSEGTVLICTSILSGLEKPRLIALRPDGTEAWSFEADGGIVGPPTIWEDVIFFGSTSGNLFRMNSRGEILSYVPTGGPISSSPVVSPDGTFCFSSSDGFLYSVNPAQGVKWKTSIPPDEEGFVSLGPDGTIYYVGGNELHAFSPEGREKWQIPFVSFNPPAIGADGTLYLGHLNSIFYAVSPVDGRVKWRFQTEGPIYSAPAIDSGGNIYFGSRDHKVYALCPDGSILWSFETGGPVDGSPAIGPDETLYIYSDDGLYAFGPPQPPALELLQPQGGQLVPLDQPFEIKWHTRNPPQGVYSVRVEVSLNGQPFQIIAQGQDTGSVSWTPRTPGSAVIRISLLSTEMEVLCETQSNPFSIGTSEGIFSDVQAGYWAFAEIRSLVHEGVINGYPDGTFRPENPVTRAEFAKMILLTCDYAPEYPGSPSFPDVPRDEWYYPYVEGAVKHGLVVGYPDGSFKPNGNITIAEVLTVIARAGDFPLSEPPSNILIPEGDSFRSIDQNDWFFGFVGAAEDNGIICFPDYHQIVAPGPGAGDSFIVKFNTPATRAQTSVFLSRLISYWMMGM